MRLRHSKRIIWADAVCINQQDDAEKSHQVPLMGSIYSLAKTDAVWLGPGDVQHTRPAFECSERIAIACYEFDHLHGRELNDPERHGELSLPESWFDSSALSSLRELFIQP